MGHCLKKKKKKQEFQLEPHYPNTIEKHFADIQNLRPEERW